MQNFLEMIVSFLRGLVERRIGDERVRQYLPIIGALFVFIAMGNLFGLFFFLQPPTGSLSTTVALAVSRSSTSTRRASGSTAWSVTSSTSWGRCCWIAPLFFVIEIIGTFARILSLSLRLFMNIFGEHTTTNVFASLRADRRALADDGPRDLHGAPAGVHLRAALGGLHRAAMAHEEH